MYFSLSDYDYSFNPSLIAQTPCEPRDHARLLVVDRKSGLISHHRFDDLPSLLDPETLIVLNDSRVIPARLYAKKETGGRVEILLHRYVEENRWEAFTRPAKKVRTGTKLTIGPDFFCTVEKELNDGLRLLSFSGCSMEEGLARYGEMPLPPYLNRSVESGDSQDYQTVFANTPGSVAAPTAGLHFTDALLQKFSAREARITLHVGAGTFLPVKSDDIRNHAMHTELATISDEAAKTINNAVKVCCVGTTSCRTLESRADKKGYIESGSFATNLFIYPGYQFRRADILLTNFHLPKTTLLMLVCTFGGYDLIMEAYRQAVEKKYRFFSYGDAMLIL